MQSGNGTIGIMASDDVSSARTPKRSPIAGARLHRRRSRAAAALPGASPASRPRSIRQAAREPGFLAGVLQFHRWRMSRRCMRFAEQAGISAGDSVAGDCARLPFGDDAHQSIDMSDDPETARQIAELSRGHAAAAGARRRRGADRIRPALRAVPRQARRRPEARHVPAATATPSTAARALPSKTSASPRCSTAFFDVQADWQTVADGAAEAVADACRQAPRSSC